MWSTLQCLINSKTDTFICLSQYAYEPGWVYFFLIMMMLLSAIGLPFPEEVTLVSVGILAYIGQNPDKYPPPFVGAPHINPTTAAIVAFLAVLLSDFLIYSIGRFFGRRVFEWNIVKRFISPENKVKIENWTHKYGALACGIFRFTPGLRFPGHLACGIVKFPLWKFLAVDGIAALISVPTQVLLFAHYGEHIYGTFRKLKYVIFGALILFAIYYIFKKRASAKKAEALNKNLPSSSN